MLRGACQIPTWGTFSLTMATLTRYAPRRRSFRSLTSRRRIHGSTRTGRRGDGAYRGGPGRAAAGATAAVGAVGGAARGRRLRRTGDSLAAGRNGSPHHAERGRPRGTTAERPLRAGSG